MYQFAPMNWMFILFNMILTFNLMFNMTKMMEKNMFIFKKTKKLV